MSEPILDQDVREASLPDRILRMAALAGGLMLFAVMLLVTVSVFFRYVLNQPILGSQELVQIGMSIVVMLAMPYTAARGQHIRVDIFDERLGRWGRFICDLIARSLSIAVLALLVQKAWDKAWDAHEFEDVTNMIEIPVWIAYAAIVLGMALFILVLLMQLWQQFRTGVSNYD